MRGMAEIFVSVIKQPLGLLSTQASTLALGKCIAQVVVVCLSLGSTVYVGLVVCTK